MKNIWLWIIAIFIVLFLTGCSSRPSATDMAAEVVRQQVVSIERQVEAVRQTLTPECKTPAINTQLSGIEQTLAGLKASAEALPGTCRAELGKLQAEKDKLALKLLVSFLMLTALGFLYVKRI